MPTKKKAGGRKRDNEADLAELERLRKQVAEQARKEEENQGKRQVSSRRQRTLVRWDGTFSFFSFIFIFLPSLVSSFCLGSSLGLLSNPGTSMDRLTVVTRTCIHAENFRLNCADI